MGYAEVLNRKRADEARIAREAADAAAAAEAVSLRGLVVALDVQHAYREGKHARDLGSRFTLNNGTHVWEAAAAAAYARAAGAWLASRGAAVLTNRPPDVLTGPYQRRHRAVNAAHAHAYLACHVNAGAGTYALAEYMVGTPGQTLADAIGARLTATFREIRGFRTFPLTEGRRGAVCVQWVDRRIPALVLEPFFGDTPGHQAIFEPVYTAALGAAIGAGLAAWWQGAKASAIASGAA